MSVPLPMKATSLSVKNTLHANEVWAESLNVKDKKSKKYVNVSDYIEEKIENVIDMEAKLKSMIQEFNKVVNEIQVLKNSMELPLSSKKQTSDVPGPAGPAGPAGPTGPAGKIGPRGLRGLKGEGLTQISLASDVDVKKLKDGDVLVWSKENNKWIAQSIYEEE